MNLNTGDLILFHSKQSLFGSLIQYFTGTDYSHVGIILKDPTFLDKSLSGLYIWESGFEKCGDAEDKKYKLGVQITDFKKVFEASKKGSNIYIRKLITNKNIITNEKLKKIYDVVHNKPYDILPSDWLEAWLKYDSSPQKKNRFWCSALTGYIYTKLGLLPSNFDWSISIPADFSTENSNKNFILKKNVKLSKEIFINDIKF